MPGLAAAVSTATAAAITGTFQRHTSPRVRTLAGSPSGGRWGYPGAYAVLYLGRPTSSVTIEAYRHLVDDTEGMTGDGVGPRTLWTVDVSVTDILDLRDPGNRAKVSLTLADLQSATDRYDPCQRVAQAAYQLQMHGIIAPAAEGSGETLALFDEHLPAEELPVVATREIWGLLPPDPRILQLVREPGIANDGRA